MQLSQSATGTRLRSQYYHSSKRTLNPKSETLSPYPSRNVALTVALRQSTKTSVMTQQGAESLQGKNGKNLGLAAYMAANANSPPAASSSVTRTLTRQARQGFGVWGCRLTRQQRQTLRQQQAADPRARPECATGQTGAQCLSSRPSAPHTRA